TDRFSEGRSIMKHQYRVARLLASLALLTTTVARADALHDWNVKAIEAAVAARMPPALATRTTAIVQTAVYEAVNAATGRYPAGELKLRAAPSASIDAAIAAANHVVLAKLIVAQSPAIDAAFQAALAAIPDGAAKSDGVALGEAAAEGVLALRNEDGTTTAE